eukprot:1151760-Pelagomonas_calceolata.AAC.15
MVPRLMCLPRIERLLPMTDSLAGEVNVELLLVSLFSLVVSLSTEVLKFARGMQGGETGTGGRF